MPQQGGQCPFCQLIDNPKQLMTVAESDNFYAWLEVNPRAKGHTMIVPKEHKENILEFSSDEWTEAFNLTREVVEKAKQGLDADGASITVNIEEAGGQMLPHAYIQVFPRFQEEENSGTPTGAIFPQREELQQQLESIQGEMSSVSVDTDGGGGKEVHSESQNFKDPASKLGGIGSSGMKESREKEESVSQESESKEPDEKDESADKDGEKDQFSGTGNSTNNTEKIADPEQLSEEQLLEELVRRKGSIDEFLRSDELKSAVSESEFELRKVSEEPHGSQNWI